MGSFIRRWMVVVGVVVAVAFVAALGATAWAQGGTDVSRPNNGYSDGAGWGDMQVGIPQRLGIGMMGMWDGVRNTMGDMWGSVSGRHFEDNDGGAYGPGPMMGNWRGGPGGMMGNWGPASRGSADSVNDERWTGERTGGE